MYSRTDRVVPWRLYENKQSCLHLSRRVSPLIPVAVNGKHSLTTTLLCHHGIEYFLYHHSDRADLGTAILYVCSYMSRITQGALLLCLKGEKASARNRANMSHKRVFHPEARIYSQRSAVVGTLNRYSSNGQIDRTLSSAYPFEPPPASYEPHISYQPCQWTVSSRQLRRSVAPKSTC